MVRITLPPLRKRKGDIALLTRHFIERYNQKMKRDIRGISEQALRRLEQYSWPGNVRELQNVVEGAYVSARSEMLMVDHMTDILDQGLMELDQEPAGGDAIVDGFSLPQALEQYERELVRRAMAQSRSISQAARLLGVSRQNLKYRLQKFNL